MDAEGKHSIQRYISCEIGEYGQIRERSSLNSKEQCTQKQDKLKQNKTRIKEEMEVLGCSDERGRGTKGNHESKQQFKFYIIQ